MILRLTDGTTTCDLVWHSVSNRKYMQTRDTWAPKVPPRRESALGGRGSFEVVEEAIPLQVCGDSAIEVLANLAALATLLDAAERWWAGEFGISPVKVQYTPNGGAQLCEALILGPAPGNQTSGVELPVSFNSSLNAYMTGEIILRFLHTSPWLGSVTQSATSGSSAMPAVLTATLATVQAAASPTKLTLSGPLQRTSNVFRSGILVIAPPTRIELFEAESMTDSGSSGTVSSTADSAAHASGGNVLRMAPAGGSLFQLFKDFTGPFAALAFEVEIFAAVRINGGSATSTCTATMQGWRSGDVVAYGPTKIIAKGAGTPQIVSFGSIASRLPFDRLFLSLFYTDATITSVDIDYIVCVATNGSEDCWVIGFDGDASLLAFTGATSTNAVALTIDHAALTEPGPYVEIANTTAATKQPWSWNGDAFVTTKPAAVGAIFLSTAGFWRPWDTTGAAAISFTLAAVRTPGMVTPQ